MPEKKICPRCGMTTATTLACEHCGYRFHAEEGEVEFSAPGELGGMPLRVNLRALVAAGGVLVLVMCICPQTWLAGGELADDALGIKEGFWSFSNATAAAIIACPVIYGIMLLIAGMLAWRKQRRANSPR